MYEEYTDKQIVEMLKPKLEKLGYGELVEHPEDYSALCRLCATLYKSGYIRGQLGRSFIIGEKKKKKNKKWVPVTAYNTFATDKVRYNNSAMHEQFPQYYPAPGTIGIVIVDAQGGYYIQWPKNSTSGKDYWPCVYRNLEVLVCE